METNGDEDPTRNKLVGDNDSSSSQQNISLDSNVSVNQHISGSDPPHPHINNEPLGRYPSRSATMGSPGRPQMSERVRRRWEYAIRQVIKGAKLRRILVEYVRSEGVFCVPCSSMELNERNFLINEYSKHRRKTRLPAPVFNNITSTIQNEFEILTVTEDMKLGLNGFRLGTLKEIFSRHTECPFCGLIIESLTEQPRKLVTAGDRQGNPTIERDVSHWLEQDPVCYASWQVDGRVLNFDSSGNIVGSRACTRRIRLRWSWPEFHDTHVVLMGKGTQESPGLFLGRTINSAWIGPEAFRKWAELCLDNHGSKCQSRTQDLSQWNSFFGVIDVIDMRLTSLPLGGRYVALSYVWGSSRSFTAREGNFKALLRFDGFRRYLPSLPRTIRDAIELVRALGERYLWVDALCIIQDSKRSWALNSRIMDLVYGKAYLTICAADGQDSNSGLRGFDPALSSTPQQIIVQCGSDVQLMCTQTAEYYIRQSVWNTRAWTFQERLLSTRTLIFVHGHVYFQCRCTARSADIVTEDKAAGWSIEFIESPYLLLDQLSEAPLIVYKKALELYLARSLTFQGDILAAFNGIGNLVCDALGGSLIHGLPSSHFDWALLWDARDTARLRRDHDGNRFPSWSWCGWIGRLEYKPHMLWGLEENMGDWLMNHTWIEWYVRDFNGNLRRVWEDNANSSSPKRRDSAWRGYHRLEVPGNADAYDSYGRYIKEENRHLTRSHFEQIIPQCPYGVTIVENNSLAQQYVALNSMETDLPYLQFFTWSAFFRIREQSQQDWDHASQRYSILDYKDDYCGTIVLERLWAKVLDPEKLLEFIAISEAKHFDVSEYDGWAYYIPKERVQSTWDLYYVLLIEYKNDIAYRVGLGKVFKDAFNNSCKSEGKQWKEFILG